MLFSRKKKYRDFEIQPDEILIDTYNISDMDRQQFQGVIEQRISKKRLTIVAWVIGIISAIFIFQLVTLQIVRGESLTLHSESNRLNTIPIFSERGVIYDRNNVELAWNTTSEDKPFLLREYIKDDGYGHLLGYLSYPKKDDNGNYWREGLVGKDGLEKKYDADLAGENGKLLFEVNVHGDTISQQHIQTAESGKNIITTIDSRLQGPLFNAIKKQANLSDFKGGAGVIMDIHSGGLLSITSYPEYNSNVLSSGENQETINSYFSDPSKPFLNRAISGLYSPGSTVKPFLALAALNEEIINQDTKINSTGRVEVPNTFNPGNFSYFRDWRPGGHGPTDVFHGIADSVNTFFYAIGGGYRNQEGLGIVRIDNYLRSFGFSEVTGINFAPEYEGIIPTPEWKEKLFDDGTWRLGDTYNTSIGQFGFQVSVLQMTRSIAALANGGKLHTPYIVNKSAKSREVEKNISPQDYSIIRRAMRQTVTNGTASILNIPELEISAKTGTAQVGSNNEFKNSWSVGFFPSQQPKYAFAIVMERAPNTVTNVGSAARTTRDFLKEVGELHPEFYLELKSG